MFLLPQQRPACLAWMVCKMGSKTGILPSRRRVSTSVWLHHLPRISQSIQERRARHTGHCLWSKNELISDVFRWTPTHEHTHIGLTRKNYIYLGHMLPGWHCSVTYCQDDTAEAHWLGIWNFASFTIFSWSLVCWHFYKCQDTFLRQKTFRSKGEVETVFEDFLASKPLEFYRTGINKHFKNHLEYSDFCLHVYCYIHNILAVASIGLLQVLLVEIGSLHGTSKRTLYLIHEGIFVFIPLSINRYKC